MLNIDKLRYTYEKPFLDLMEEWKGRYILIILIIFFGIRIISGILNRMKKLVHSGAKLIEFKDFFLKPIIHLNILIFNQL